MDFKEFKKHFPIGGKESLWLIPIIAINYFFFNEIWVPYSLLFVTAIWDGIAIFTTWNLIFRKKYNPKFQLAYSLILISTEIILHVINYQYIGGLSFLLLPATIFVLLFIHISIRLNWFKRK